MTREELIQRNRAQLNAMGQLVRLHPRQFRVVQENVGEHRKFILQEYSGYHWKFVARSEVICEAPQKKDPHINW